MAGAEAVIPEIFGKFQVRNGEKDAKNAAVPPTYVSQNATRESPRLLIVAFVVLAIVAIGGFATSFVIVTNAAKTTEYKAFHYSSYLPLETPLCKYGYYETNTEVGCLVGRIQIPREFCAPNATRTVILQECVTQPYLQPYFAIGICNMVLFGSVFFIGSIAFFVRFL